MIAAAAILAFSLARGSPPGGVPTLSAGCGPLCKAAKEQCEKSCKPPKVNPRASAQFKGKGCATTCREMKEKCLEKCEERRRQKARGYE